MSFFKGLAEGFIDERDKVRARDAEKEDLDFRYKMEELTRRKSLRDEQRLKEIQWKTGAEAAARAIGDPSFLPVAYEQMAAGRNLDEVMNDVKNGYWSRDPNAPDRQARTVNLAPAPQPTARETMVSDEAPVKQRKLGMLEQIEADKQAKRSANVNKRIQEVDPTLLEEANDTPSNPYQAVESGGWSFKNTDTQKLPPYAQSLYDLEKATQRNDVEGILRAKEQVRVHQIVRNREAKEKARVEGKDIRQFAMVDPKTGVLKSVEYGYESQDADGQKVILNAATDKPLVEGDDGKFVPIFDDKIMQDYEKLAKDYGSRSDKHNVSVNEYAGALTAVNEIGQMFRQDPALASSFNGVLEGIRSIQANVQAGYQALVDQGNILSQKARTGIIDHQTVADYENKIQDFLSQPNRDRAQNYVLYQSLRTLTAIKFAAANGIDGKNMSDKDFNRFYEATAKGSDPETVMNQLFANSRIVWSSIYSSQLGLDKDQQVAAFEKRAKFKTGLSGVRVGDRLEEMGRGDLKGMFDTYVYKPWAAGAAGAVYKMDAAKAGPAPTQQAPQAAPAQGGIPAGAIEMLKKNPNLRDKFDEKFGAGSAAKILGE